MRVNVCVYGNVCVHASQAAIYPPELLVLQLKPAALPLASPLSPPPLGGGERRAQATTTGGSLAFWFLYLLWLDHNRFS